MESPGVPSVVRDGQGRQLDLGIPARRDVGSEDHVADSRRALRINGSVLVDHRDCVLGSLLRCGLVGTAWWRPGGPVP
jgi:hypothetical protein